MPLLSNAKTCYVGTTPITKIYAGTQFVWPKVPVELLDFQDPQWNLFNTATPSDPSRRLCAFSWQIDGDLCKMWKDNILVVRLFSRPAPNGYFSYTGSVPGTQALTGSMKCYTEGNRIYFSDASGTPTPSLASYSTQCSICQYYKGSLLQESSSIVPNSWKNPYPPIDVGFDTSENLCT